MLFFDFHYLLGNFCAQVGGLGFALWVGVDSVVTKMRKYWLTNMKILEVGLASGMAGSVRSVIFPEIHIYVLGGWLSQKLNSFFGPLVRVMNPWLFQILGLYLGLSWEFHQTSQGGFWVTSPGSQALPWAFHCAQGKGVLWAPGSHRKPEGKRGNKIDCYSYPWHFKIVVRSLACLSEPCVVDAVDVEN